MSAVYFMNLHCKPNENSELFGKAGGAYINVLCIATSADDAKQQALSALHDWDLLEVDIAPQPAPRSFLRQPPKELREHVKTAVAGGIGMSFVTYPAVQIH